MIELMLLLGCAHAEEPTPKVDSALRVASAGGEGWLGVELSVPKGWHIYWDNPGQTGMATTVEGTLSEGTLGALRYPTPERIVAPGDIVAYGYHGTVTLMLPYTGAGTATVEASWLICRELCIPQGASLSTKVDGGSDNLDAALAALPGPVPPTPPRWEDGAVVLPGTIFPSEALELKAQVVPGRIIGPVAGLGGVVLQDGQGYTFTIPDPPEIP